MRAFTNQLLHCVAFTLLASTAPSLHAQVAVRADQVFTMTGDFKPLRPGIILCGADGKIQQVGSPEQVAIPAGVRVLQAAVAVPGIIDARATAGMSGLLNLDGKDQEQFERSAPLQPELRAFDAYNGRDELVKHLRELGVTTLHTGHAPGMLVSGQTMVLKTNIQSITQESVMLSSLASVSVSLGEAGVASEGKKSPGTRAKAVAMLRTELLKAADYRDKLAKAEADKKPARDLHLEILANVLDGKVPLLVTADRHHDIAAALRLREEFGFRLILDSAAEAWLLLEEIKAAKVPVIIHPTMARPNGDKQSIRFSLAAKLHAAGIPFAFQSGYEGYVPKTRVVLFEAAMAAAHGLPQEHALAGCTIHAATILGLEKRIGSLVPGKDADLALYNGDPLETTSHCVGVIIDGKVVSEAQK